MGHKPSLAGGPNKGRAAARFILPFSFRVFQVKKCCQILMPIWKLIRGYFVGKNVSELVVATFFVELFMYGWLFLGQNLVYSIWQHFQSYTGRSAVWPAEEAQPNFYDSHSN